MQWKGYMAHKRGAAGKKMSNIMAAQHVGSFLKSDPNIHPPCSVKTFYTQIWIHRLQN